MKVETRKTARVSARAAPATPRGGSGARDTDSRHTHDTAHAHTYLTHVDTRARALYLRAHTRTHCVYVGLRNVGLYALVRAIGHAHTTFYTNCRSPLHVHACSLFSSPSDLQVAGQGRLVPPLELRENPATRIGTSCAVRRG